MSTVSVFLFFSLCSFLVMAIREISEIRAWPVALVVDLERLNCRGYFINCLFWDLSTLAEETEKPSKAFPFPKGPRRSHGLGGRLVAEAVGLGGCCKYQTLGCLRLR